MSSRVWEFQRGTCQTCWVLNTEVQLGNEEVVIKQLRTGGFNLSSTGYRFFVDGKVWQLNYDGPDITFVLKDVLFFVELDGGFHKPGPSNKYRDDVTRSIAISKWWAGSGNPQSKKPSVWIRIGYSRELATNRPDWYDTIEQIAMSCMDNEQKLVADKPLYFYCNYDESHWQFKKAKETFKKRQLHLVESSKEITNVGIQYKPGHMFAARTPSSAARRASPSSTSSLRSASRRIARRRRGST